MPNSLLGQVMLALAAGLLIAQIISAALLYRAAQQRIEGEQVSALAFRLVWARDNEDRRTAREDRALQPRRHHRAMRQRMRIERADSSPVAPGEVRLPQLEQALREVLSEQGVAAGEIVVTQRRAGDDPWIRGLMERWPRWGGPDWVDRQFIVAGVEDPQSGMWRIARLPKRPAPRGVLGGILLQTVVTLLVLFAALFVLIRRITRPLAQLTERVEAFAHRPGEALALEERGPADTRRLIAAHNAMEARIAAMLNEKDVMLGAIGHDLKTPLAALRVRIEAVEDDGQRARMAEGIEEITRSLDDILNLARVGRASEPPEPTSLDALAASVVAEYEDMDEPVELIEGARVVANVRARWLRGALRNLIGNALRYAGAAKVVVREEEGMAVLRVLDSGPGIPEEKISAMFEPFARGEESRNRATGGTGLGLTLARAVAEQHGGTLVLSNRDEGGLRAELRVPLKI